MLPPPSFFSPLHKGKRPKRSDKPLLKEDITRWKDRDVEKRRWQEIWKKRGNLANTGSTFKKIRASGKKIQATTTNFNKRQPKALPRLSLCVFFFWKGTQKKETKKKKEWVLIWLCKCKQDFLPTGSRFSLWPVLLANLPFKTNSPGEAAPPLLNGIIMIY